jgi:hypothetical protein
MTVAFFSLAGSIQAERFFQTNDTYYEKIPAIPRIRANPANCVNEILIGVKGSPTTLRFTPAKRSAAV